MADEVVQTPFGQFLVDPEDCIGGTLKAGTCWDGPGFLQPLAVEHAAFGTPGVTILDVGANFGSFTIWCAAQGAWRVVAVEPIPETLRYLKASLDLNQATCATSVILLPLAAYDRRCTVWSPDYSMRNRGGAAVVPDATVDRVGPMPAAPLDDYRSLCGTRVSFLKIDAQGCDGAVLRGAIGLIERDHPLVVFEWEDRLAPPHGYTLPDTIAWLTDRGYQTIEWPSHPHNFVARWSK